MVCEAAAVAVVGAALGLALGAALHPTFLDALADMAGFPIHYRFTARPSLLSAAVVVAGVGGALPALRAPGST